MTFLRSLKHLPFAWLWSGQTISRLGDSLYRIALSWWVLEKTGSATIMGAVLIFSFAPALIFSLIGGVAVDRFSRVWVMIVSDLARGITVLVVSLMSATGQLEIWHVYVASIIFGVVDAFFYPAFTAILPDITPKELLTSANSLTSLSANITNIVGPAFAALLVKLGGTSLGFGLDSLSFFISVACLLPLLHLPKAIRKAVEKTNMLGQLKEGIRAVMTSPWLWITISLASLANVTYSGPLAVSLPFLVERNLGGDVNAFGLIASFSAAGSLLGAVFLGRFHRLRRRGPLAYGAWILGGLMLVIYGFSHQLWLVLAAAFVNGATLVTFGLIWTNTLQEQVSSELLGRVSSIDYLGSFVLLPVSYAVAGMLTDQFGPSSVFIGGGLATIIILSAGLLSPAIRGLD